MLDENLLGITPFSNKLFLNFLEVDYWVNSNHKLFWNGLFKRRIRYIDYISQLIQIKRK